MKDPSGEFFTDLVQHHISGQLKVAPSTIGPHPGLHGQAHIEVYEKFRRSISSSTAGTARTSIWCPT